MVVVLWFWANGYDSLLTYLKLFIRVLWLPMINELLFTRESNDRFRIRNVMKINGNDMHENIFYVYLDRYSIIKCNIHSHTWGKWSCRDTWVSLHRSFVFCDPISMLRNLICIRLPWLRPYLLWRCPPSILSIGGASIIHWQRVLGGYRPGLWKPGLCNI